MTNITQENIRRRKKRRKQTAEVFTPPKLVGEMVNKLPKEVWEEGKTFIDPACGNGNFLIHILWRKLHEGQDSIKALESVYGLDIMRDNIRECRLRLLKIISMFEDITEEHIKIVFTNIRFLSLKAIDKRTGKLRHPHGSLSYDMSFKKKYNQKNVDKWLEKIKNGELELVKLPVEDMDDISTLVENKNLSIKGVEDIDLFEEEMQ